MTNLACHVEVCELTLKMGVEVSLNWGNILVRLYLKLFNGPICISQLVNILAVPFDIDCVRVR